MLSRSKVIRVTRFSENFTFNLKVKVTEVFSRYMYGLTSFRYLLYIKKNIFDLICVWGGYLLNQYFILNVH